MNLVNPPARRRRFLRPSLAAVALCGILGATTGFAQEPVKIGFIGTLSGPGGALGQDQYDAFMLAIEQNDGKLGGVPVEVVREDDKLKPDIGVQIGRASCRERGCQYV